MRPATALLLAAILGIQGQALADAPTNEDRLRDALREAVSRMHAAQDQAAQAQADLLAARNAQQALQSQLEATRAAPAATPVKPADNGADVRNLQAALEQARAQNAALQQGLAKWQGAYQAVAVQAQAKASDAQQVTAHAAAGEKMLALCRAENTRLVSVAEDILTLYRSQSFRSILLRSYEPFIGSAKVKLENMVQDYDGKIHDQEFVATVPPPGH